MQVKVGSQKSIILGSKLHLTVLLQSTNFDIQFWQLTDSKLFDLHWCMYSVFLEKHPASQEHNSTFMSKYPQFHCASLLTCDLIGKAFWLVISISGIILQMEVSKLIYKKRFSIITGCVWTLFILGSIIICKDAMTCKYIVTDLGY